MKVELIASTVFHGVDGYTPDDRLARDDPQHVIEAAGRSCYLSFHKPNPATASNESYVANLLSQRHYSVLEHASASFYVSGVSRNMTHELIRHRMFSFSEVSQRYVAADRLGIVRPPAFGNGDWLWLQRSREAALTSYESFVSRASGLGLRGKRAREAARAFLPSSTETRIMVSGNFRAWLEFLLKRDDPAADAEIRLFAQNVGEKLSVLAPHVFGVSARKLWSSDSSQEQPVRDV